MAMFQAESSHLTGAFFVSFIFNERKNGRIRVAPSNIGREIPLREDGLNGCRKASLPVVCKEGSHHFPHVMDSGLYDLVVCYTKAAGHYEARGDYHFFNDGLITRHGMPVKGHNHSGSGTCVSFRGGSTIRMIEARIMDVRCRVTPAARYKSAIPILNYWYVSWR